MHKLAKDERTNEPVPFFLAMLLVIGAIWAAFAWAYKARIENRKELYEMLVAEAQLGTQASERREAELKATLDKQAEQIKVLEAKKDQMPAAVSRPSQTWSPRQTPHARKWNSSRPQTTKGPRRCAFLSVDRRCLSADPVISAP